MKYTAVLFDLDGTLLDTLQDIADSVNEALDRLGFPGHKTEGYKGFIGEGREALAIRALPERHRDAATVARMLDLLDKEYSRRWVDHTRPYPGVTDLLDALAATNIRMAVLSNKPHDLTELMTSKLLPKWHFEAVVGALPSLPKKPDPAGALAIAQRLNIKPSRFLYVGDSGVDMNTATAAGMCPVGVSWGFRSADELLAAGAKVLIDRPGDLLRLL